MMNAFAGQMSTVAGATRRIVRLAALALAAAVLGNLQETTWLTPASCHGQTTAKKDYAIVSDFAEAAELQSWKPNRAGPESKVELMPGPEGTRAARIVFASNAKPGEENVDLTLARTFNGKAMTGASFTRLTFWHKGDRMRVFFVEQDRGDFYSSETSDSKEWHRVAICFADFKPGYNAGGKGKGTFDLTRMERLCLKLQGTPGKTKTAAVAQIALERSDDDADPRLFSGSQTPTRLDLYPQKLNLPVNRTQPLIVVVGNERRCGLNGLKVELSLEGSGSISPHADRAGSQTARLLQVITDTEGIARARFHPAKSVGQRTVISARLVDTSVPLTARAGFVTAAEFHKVRLGSDGFFVKPDGQRIIPLGGFWMSWFRKVEEGEARKRIILPLPCTSPSEQHAWYAYLKANGVNCLRGYWMPSPPCNTIFPLGDAGQQDMSRLDASGKIIEPVVAALERTLAIGGEHGIGSTLTIAPCAGVFIGGGSGNGAWRRLPEGKTRAQVMHEADDFLRAIVPRLMFNPHVWAYELMNEQNDNTFAWSDRFIRMIKELDEETPVMASLCVGLHSFDPLAWMRNTSLDIFQPHFYPAAGTPAVGPDGDVGLSMEVHSNAMGGPKPWLLGESGMFGFEQEEKGGYLNRDCLWFALLNRACGAFLWADDHRSVTQCKLAADIIPLVDWKSLSDALGAVTVPIPRDTSGRTAFATAEGRRTLGVMTDYSRWALERGVSLDFPATSQPEAVSCPATAFSPPAIQPPFDIGKGYQLKCRMSRDGRLVLGYLRNISGIALEKKYYIRLRKPVAAEVKWRLPAERYSLSVWDLDTGHREKVEALKTGQWKHDPTEHDFVLLWQAGK